MQHVTIREGKRAARPVGGWPKPRSNGPVKNGFERMPPSCQAVIFTNPYDKGRPCAETHPFAVRVTCGRCLPCSIVLRDQRLGRILSEQATASAAAMVTYTYAPDPRGFDPAGAVKIEKEDWIALRKAMHKRYGQLEYSGAFEMGEILKRVHAHIIWFWYPENKKPEWLEVPRYVEAAYKKARIEGTIGRNGRFLCCGVECAAQTSKKKAANGIEQIQYISWIPEWPHGYVNISEVTEQSAGYVSKYCLKKENADQLRKSGSVRRSLDTYRVSSQKLGYRHMRWFGEDAARQGLEVPDRYTVAGSTIKSGRRKGEARQYTMTRGMKRELCDAYMRTIATMLASGEIKEWRCKPTGATRTKIRAVIQWPATWIWTPSAIRKRRWKPSSDS